VQVRVEDRQLGRRGRERKNYCRQDDPQHPPPPGQRRFYPA
jgi:hypothetical protein